MFKKQLEQDEKARAVLVGAVESRDSGSRMLLKKVFLASVLLMVALATDPLTCWPQAGRNYLAHLFLEHRMALEPLGLGPPNPGR